MMTRARFRSALAWRISDATEAAQRFAHGLDPNTPSPEDADRCFDAGLMGGSGDFAAMALLRPTVDMLERAAGLHHLPAHEVLRQAEEHKVI